MKPGEKAALWVVAAALVGIVGLTVFLELQRQEKGGHTHQTAAMDPALALIPTGMNPDALPDPASRGASALVTYCVQCHDLPVPTMHTAAEWDAVLKRMDQQIQTRRSSGMLSRVAMPSAEAWAALHAYLTAHGQRPADTTRLADLDTLPGQAYKNICAQCHAVPDPTQHTTKEWPRVVLRMKSNMLKGGKIVPDDTTAEMIVAYLQSHSSDQAAASPGQQR